MEINLDMLSPKVVPHPSECGGEDSAGILTKEEICATLAEHSRWRATHPSNALDKLRTGDLGYRDIAPEPVLRPSVLSPWQPVHSAPFLLLLRGAGL